MQVKDFLRAVKLPEANTNVWTSYTANSKNPKPYQIQTVSIT